MEHYAYIIRLARPEMADGEFTAEDEAVLERHSEYLDRITTAGTCIMAGHMEDAEGNPMGIVLIRAEGIDVARGVMDADPGVAEGLMKATVHPFNLVFTGKFD